MYFYLTEEPYDGSGSGSGAGIDDEDESGSGLSPFDSDHDGGHTRTGVISPDSGTVNITTDVVGSDKDGKTKTNIDTNNVDSSLNKGNEKGGAASTQASQMSLGRALLTYLLPIYLAWFGGVVCELL